MTLATHLRSLGRGSWALLAGLVRAYAEVLFLSRTTVGLVLLVGTLLNWDVGLSGLIAVASACLFARATKIGEQTLASGYYTYNPLLVGLSLGATLSLSWLSAVLIAVAGVMTFLTTAVLVHVLRYYLNLPALSLPFVIVSAVTHTAAMRYASLAPAPRQVPAFLARDYGLPLAAAGFLKSIGAVFFVPSVLIGAMFATLLLVRSRIMFVLAVGGYCVGTTLRGALLDSWEQAYGDMMSFNFILAAIAVGGIFLVPSATSLLAAAVAVAVAVVLVDAVQVFGYFLAVPAYTLPFNLATLGVTYALAVNQFPGMTKFFGPTPEDNLENDLVRRARFDPAGRSLSLPFLGRWSVWQAADDEWTHQGPWRHAYDFVIVDDDGRTHREGGTQPTDFHCWRKPVVAPCRGRVTKVVEDLLDNPIGRVDQTNNWGNHIVIYDDRGFYVELSHFAYHSIKVAVGDRVEPGTLLGLCGNSGYSPQPHLHIHVQATGRVGDPTLPFAFASYVRGSELIAQGRPAKGESIEPAESDECLAAATDFLLNDAFHYEVRREGRPTGAWTITVRMALDGTFFFESSTGGRLYFGKLDGTFYCYRVEGSDALLELIQRALPRLPLVSLPGLEWHDVVPISLLTSGLRRAAYRFAAMFAGRFALARTTQRFVGANQIETKLVTPDGQRRVARVLLDPQYGFAAFHEGPLELRLLRTEIASGNPGRRTVSEQLPKNRLVPTGASP